MKRFRILHQTHYYFTQDVQLGPHTLRLRPREGPELRIETSSLTIQPTAVLRWHRDAEENAVASASFSTPSNQLLIESDTTIQQYNQAPYDFLVSDYAEQYPFQYSEEDRVMLAPYMYQRPQTKDDPLSQWLADICHSSENIQSYTLLKRLNEKTHKTLKYQMREEPGVQSANESLALRSGSCRDLAQLFIEATRHLGFAARFVTGYIYSPGSALAGSTHAWAEVFLPGAGWKGFDPTTGFLVGSDHIAVAVARLPVSVPPVSGSYIGPPDSRMEVAVWVTELTEAPDEAE
ncbi:transglutaminase family protein [Pontibacter sp. JAM-7]|uniref:transglutaminase family protein n=1 Tax=Pontibacter sp. JAM-7 TaxID=3366581 RepID=UPI003AF6022B